MTNIDLNSNNVNVCMSRITTEVDFFDALLRIAKNFKGILFYGLWLDKMTSDLAKMETINFISSALTSLTLTFSMLNKSPEYGP